MVRILSRITENTIMSNHFAEIWDDTNNYYGFAFQVLTEKGSLLADKGIPAPLAGEDISTHNILQIRRKRSSG